MLLYVSLFESWPYGHLTRLWNRCCVVELWHTECRHFVVLHNYVIFAVLHNTTWVRHGVRRWGNVMIYKELACSRNWKLKLLINYGIFWHNFNIISGEPFNDEEIEEMMSVALDDKGNVVYKEYIPLMTVDENFTAWYSKRLNTRIWCY